MILSFADSSHPLFRATSALGRGELRSKEKGKKSVHINGSEETIELIDSSHGYFCKSARYLRSSSRLVQRTVQSTIHGAVTDLCKELDSNSWELWFGKERMSSHCVHMKRKQCALSSTPRMWKQKMGPPLVDEDWHAICHGGHWHVLQICTAAQSAQMREIWRKQEGQGAVVFERSKRQRNTCLRLGQSKEWEALRWNYVEFCSQV